MIMFAGTAMGYTLVADVDLLWMFQVKLLLHRWHC